MDMLTRDMQSAGMGLPTGLPGDNFAAILLHERRGCRPRSVMMLNGDPFAPTALVKSQTGLDFVVDRPLEVPIPTPVSGTSQIYNYIGEYNVQTGIYDDFTADPRRYLVYDSVRAMTFTLANNGVSAAPNSQITLTRNATGFDNPATDFGSALDLGEPTNYNDTSTKIAVLNQHSRLPA